LPAKRIAVLKLIAVVKVGFAALTLVAIIFVVFIGGLATGYFKIYPFEVFRAPLKAADAVISSRQGFDDIRDRFSGAKPHAVFDINTPPVRDEKTGLGRYQAELAQPGYTVYIAIPNKTIFLKMIDMQGNEVHEWRVPLEDVAKIIGETQLSPGKRELLVTDVLPEANGDLLMTLTISPSTPWGRGLLKLDKDSNVIWVSQQNIHHQFDIGPNQEIYALGHYIEKTPRAGLEKIETPFLDDTVLFLSPDGESLRYISLLNAFRDSDYSAALIYADPHSYNGDLLHANSVHYVTEAAASNLNFAQPGQLLLSFRNMSLIALLDPDSEAIVWARRGQWHLQHNAEFLPDGHLMLFDNRGDLDNAGGSRVIEVDPTTGAIVWEFPGSTGETLYSSIKSSQQRLANGNTLIVETNNGRLLEVTPAGEVVWEFFVPERHERDGRSYTQVMSAVRITADWLAKQAGPQTTDSPQY
jgi:hypothetical protein